MYKISQLAHEFGLSRSTLLYYHRIGLLSPASRSSAGYRLYTPADRERLQTICTYRQAGLTIEDIASLLATRTEDGTVAVIEGRLRLIDEEIKPLQAKQRLLGRIAKVAASGGASAEVDKKAWVEMLRVAGMDDAAMKRWHEEFERRAPEAHYRFLISLGIEEAEAASIRAWSAAPARSSDWGSP